MNNKYLSEQPNIKIYLRSDDTFVAKLFVQDNRLFLEYEKDISDKYSSELNAYFDSNIPLWEKETFVTRVYDMVPAPIYRITDTNTLSYLLKIYINYILKAKKETFKMRYIFSFDRYFNTSIYKTEL
jgi:hypothetical protein